MEGTPWRTIAASLAAIAVVCALLYARSLPAPFVFDDVFYILESPLVNTSVVTFGHSRDYGVSIPLRELAPATRALGHLSFALNFRLHGFDPAGFRALNLAIHAGNAGLVYVVVLLLWRTPALRRSPLAGRAQLMGFLAALLFAAHPAQTQAVTYLSQRFASLVALWSLGAIAAYAGARLARGRLRSAALYMAALLLLVAAMKTKETAFTLPLAIALLEFSFFTGPRGPRVLALVPVLATMAIIPATLLSLDAPLGQALDAATRTQDEIPRGVYLATEARVMFTYLRLMLFPVNQTLDYDYPRMPELPSAPPLALGLFVAALAASMLVLSLRGGRREPAWRLVGFMGAFFFLSLAVESSVVALADTIFEHRLYLPSAGACVAAVAAGTVMTGGRSGPARASVVLFAVLVCALGAATIARNEVWGGEIRLWEDIVRKAPGKARGHNNLGVMYEAEGMYEEAERAYRRAIEIDPGYSNAYNNLGIIYLRQKKGARATEFFTLSLLLKPGSGTTALNLGSAYEEMGSEAEAIDAYRRAIAYDPELYPAYEALAFTHLRTGDAGAAIRVFTDAVGRFPRNPDMWYGLGTVLARTGRYAEAAIQFREALALRPGDRLARTALTIVEGAGTGEK
jgi:tetratricopeptide (TPR) repeat protein